LDVAWLCGLFYFIPDLTFDQEDFNHDSWCMQGKYGFQRSYQGNATKWGGSWWMLDKAQSPVAAPTQTINIMHSSHRFQHFCLVETKSVFS